jgi:8-oxo-dGTP pyrophosphatase MutT (NUDIX family)
VNGTQRVRPLHAASLVVVRKRQGRVEVLLGRREPRQRFMPDVYVFPGGRVDRADARRPLASHLRPPVEARLRRTARTPLPRALATAALRETFEETGLAFGDVVDGELRPGLDAVDYFARAITPAQSPRRFHARFFLADAARASGRLAGNGELLDLRWVRLRGTGRLPIADITEFVLDEAARRLASRRTHRIAFFHWRGGRPCVRYE